MARPGARGLGPGLGLNYDLNYDLNWTSTAGPGRAWASNNICGPGLGLNFRPVQGPSLHLSGKGLPFLPRDCRGRLPVAWVKYDM